MVSKHKYQSIKSGRELIRINSKYKKISNMRRNILYFIVTAGMISYAIIFIEYSKKLSTTEMIVIVSIVFSILALLIAVINVSVLRRNTVLIFTDKGIISYPDVAEYWEDIEGYSWEKLVGLERVTLTKKGAGVYLRINNKNGMQRNILPWTGHSVLSQSGVTFTCEEIRRTDEIFREHGIMKIEK